MMEEVPKKFVDGDLRCFVCNSMPPKKERVRVFGKASVDIQGLLRKVADVHASPLYSANDLFICVNACYKRLLWFEKVEKSLQSIRDEIKSDFSNVGRFRVKRMREDDIESSASSRIKLDDCHSTAKSLDFNQLSTVPATCTSYSNQVGLFMPPVSCKNVINSCTMLSRLRSTTNFLTRV